MKFDKDTINKILNYNHDRFQNLGDKKENGRIVQYIRDKKDGRIYEHIFPKGTKFKVGINPIAITDNLYPDHFPTDNGD